MKQNRMESDIPNVQIDRTRSDATEGIEVVDDLYLCFHSLTLPSGSFIWHCPYIVLFYSEDKKVFGEGYKEYAMIKINGEDDGSKEDADNKFFMEKGADFKDWENFKHACKQGIECKVNFKRKGNKITLNTENLGIKISNTTILHEGNEKVYVAITGDQVALTDIRVR